MVYEECNRIVNFISIMDKFSILFINILYTVTFMRTGISQCPLPEQRDQYLSILQLEHSKTLAFCLSHLSIVGIFH